MTTSTITLAEPFFLKVLSILDQRVPDTHELQELQRQLMADLAEIEGEIKRGETGLSGADWDTIKHVLVYWADEVLTNHISDWNNYPLEHKYYGERDRAWKFYVLAESTIPTSSSEIAEFFYLAIVLGFTGRIDEAFLDHLDRDMPGKHQGREQGVRDKARRHWARQVQQRIRHQSIGELQGESLQGGVEPIGTTAFMKAGLAAFLITLLVFTITLGWKQEWLN
jgi:type VI protein secretion system component VasF